ncbi:porin family protein [Flavobacterium sp.]
MKKIVFAFIIFTGISSIGFSQKKGDVEFGFHIGYGRSNASDTETSAEFSTGTNLGVALDYYFSNSWSIKSKLIYDQKGWDDDFIQDTNGNFYSTDIDLNYLTIPVMANWHFGNKKNWYLNFGPYFGFLLNAKETRFDTDLKEYFSSTDFGLALGIGIKIPFSDRLKLFAEFDGQGGLSDIAENSLRGSITNSRSSFNVGLNFLLR